MRVPNRLVNLVPIQLRTIFSIIWPASIITDLFPASPLDRILSPKGSLRQRHREAYTDSSWSPCTMNIIQPYHTQSNLYCPCTIQYIQKIVHRNSRSVVSIGKATLSSAEIASSSALLYAAKHMTLSKLCWHTKTKGKRTDYTDILLCKLFSVLWYWSQRLRDYTHLQSQHSIVPLHMTVGWKRLSRNCSATYRNSPAAKSVAYISFQRHTLPHRQQSIWLWGTSDTWNLIEGNPELKSIDRKLTKNDNRRSSITNFLILCAAEFYHGLKAKATRC